MNKDKLKETLVNFVVPLMALVVILVMLFVIIIPTIKSKPQKEDEIAQAAALNALLSKKVENLNKMKNLETVVGDYSELVSRVLVDEPMVPELLTQVDTIAKESGLTVTKLTYSFTEADKNAKDAPSYPTVNVSLGAEGNYEQLVTFFENLEQAARVVYVQNFRFASDDTDNSNKLSVQVTLASPYLTVDSQPKTDEPVEIDIANKDFIALVSELKKLKYYEPRVDQDVQEKAEEVTKEEQDAAAEEQPAKAPAEPTQPPVPVQPTGTPPASGSTDAN